MKATHPAKCRKDHCSKHSLDYTSKLTLLMGREIWSGCPECSREQKEKERRKDLDDLSRVNRGSACSKKFFDIVGDHIVPKRYRDLYLHDFQALNPTAKTIFDRCKNYISQFEKVKSLGTSLVFSGGVGTGKTLLACIACNELNRAGFTAAYISGFAMASEVKDTYRRDSGKSEKAVYESFVRPDLLVIDEIGVQTGSTHNSNVFFQVIQARYENIKPTFLVSNLNEKELARELGERTVDRIYENYGTVFTFDWESFRRKNQLKLVQP